MWFLEKSEILPVTASWASHCSVQNVSSAVFTDSNSCGRSFNFSLIEAIHSYHHVGEGFQIFRQEADHEVKGSTEDILT